ncbi:hypothetical protein [Pseudomonas alkylphenolica]|uniref:hypothetical protein n=1 Tax=Pseudomonas alkylphenolica TaxID=237609 RepID=UPI00315CB94B
MLGAVTNTANFANTDQLLRLNAPAGKPLQSGMVFSSGEIERICDKDRGGFIDKVLDMLRTFFGGAEREAARDNIKGFLFGDTPKDQIENFMKLKDKCSSDSSLEFVSGFDKDTNKITLKLECAAGSRIESIIDLNDYFRVIGNTRLDPSFIKNLLVDGLGADSESLISLFDMTDLKPTLSTYDKSAAAANHAVVDRVTTVSNSDLMPKGLKACGALFSSASLEEVDGFLKNLLHELQSKVDKDNFKIPFKSCVVTIDRYSVVDQLGAVISSSDHRDGFVHRHTSKDKEYVEGKYYTSYNDIISLLNKPVPLQSLA